MGHSLDSTVRNGAYLITQTTRAVQFSVFLSIFAAASRACENIQAKTLAPTARRHQEKIETIGHYWTIIGQLNVSAEATYNPLGSNLDFVRIIPYCAEFVKKGSVDRINFALMILLVYAMVLTYFSRR